MSYKSVLQFQRWNNEEQAWLLHYSFVLHISYMEQKQDILSPLTTLQKNEFQAQYYGLRRSYIVIILRKARTSSYKL